MRSLMFITLTLAGLTACNNSCQDLCKEIAAYAEECGYVIPEDEPRTCISANPRSELEREELAVCRDNADFLRQEWDCDDVGQYF